jgi:hypothetical protein
VAKLRPQRIKLKKQPPQKQKQQKSHRILRMMLDSLIIKRKLRAKLQRFHRMKLKLLRLLSQSLRKKKVLKMESINFLKDCLSL